MEFSDIPIFYKGTLSLNKSHYTETQVIIILNEIEAGRQVKEVSRKYSITNSTYYNSNSKYGDMEVFDIRKLKGLQYNNRRLQQMYDNFWALRTMHQRMLLVKSSETIGETPVGRLYYR